MTSQPLIPAKVGTQAARPIRTAASQSPRSAWVPAFAGMSGI